MTWVKLDDHFDENPKIAQVGPLGLALWVTGLAYCNRNLTDGFIPTAIALRMLSLEYDDPDERPTTILLGGVRDRGDDGQIGCVPEGYTVSNQLVKAGLWEDVPGGFQIHDFAHYQPTRAQVEAERAQKVAAGQAGGIAAAKARAKAGAQAESKPVPVPDPVPIASNEAITGDAAFKDAYGALVTAFGGEITRKLADEFTQIAEDYPVEAVTGAIRECRAVNKRCYPSNVLKFLVPPEPEPAAPKPSTRIPNPMTDPNTTYWATPSPPDADGRPRAGGRPAEVEL